MCFYIRLVFIYCVWVEFGVRLTGPGLYVFAPFTSTHTENSWSLVSWPFMPVWWGSFGGLHWAGNAPNPEMKWSILPAGDGYFSIGAWVPHLASFSAWANPLFTDLKFSWIVSSVLENKFPFREHMIWKVTSVKLSYVLCPALGSSAQEWHGPVGAGPMMGNRLEEN